MPPQNTAPPDIGPDKVRAPHTTAAVLHYLRVPPRLEQRVKPVPAEPAAEERP